jgi:hypothetical protein
MEGTMPVSLVTTREQVKEGIRRFNEDLGRAGGQELASRLGYNRAWYYDPELDQVGPSKFIGYAAMTAKRYIDEGALDGKRPSQPFVNGSRFSTKGAPKRRS